MPAPTVTLVRPDGSTLDVRREDAGVLQTLGYKPQEAEAETEAAVGQGTQDYYSTPGQKVLTGLEGAASGISLGGSDLLFNGEDTRERALYNPGMRLGGELIGSFGAPVGILGHAAEGLAEGRVLRGALLGAAEGAQFGAGAAVTNAQMNAEPLTVEAVAAGVGFGGLFGGGLGALAGKAGETVQRKVMERQALAKAAEEASAHEAVAAEKFNTVRSAVSDAKSQMEKAVEEAGDIMKSAADGPKTPEDRVATDNFNARNASTMKTANEGKGYLDALTDEGMVNRENRVAVRQAEKTYRRIVAEAADGNFARVEGLMAQFDENLQNLEEKTTKSAPRMKTVETNAEDFASPNPPPPPNPAKETAKADASAAMEQVAQMASASKHLAGFPVVESWGGISPAKAERIGGAIDAVMKLDAAEFQGIKDGLKTSIQDLADHLGVKVEGSPGTQFRGMYETVRGADKAAGVNATSKVVEGESGWFKKRVAEYVAGAAGSGAAEHFGAKGVGRLIAYDMAKNMMHGFLGIKAAVVGNIASKIGTWVPRATAKYGPRVAPRVAPLLMRLDGTRDKKSSTQELMKARAEEIRNAAPGVKDTLYKSLQPLDNFHPDLAVGLHDLSVNQFKFLLDKLPQDPGNAYSALKTLWNPDPVATEKFSRYYEVFHDPTEVITRALQTHQITPEAAEGLREMWPELYSEFRGRMLERIAHPEVSDKLSYNEQVHLGMMLSLPLHSTMTPQFIASQQQMFTERNQKLPVQAQPGAGGTNGGRPSGAGATQAQKIEQH